MKRIVFGLLVIFCLLNTDIVLGQLAGWVSYVSKIKDRPVSILVDMDIYNTDHHSAPFLVITGPVIKDCGVTGLPSADQIGKMEDILSTSSTFLTRVTSYTLAGTVTANCSRLNCYYAKDTTAIRSTLRKMYDRSFKSSEYILQCTYDPDWKYYNEILYPDEIMQEWIINSRQIKNGISMADTFGRKDALEIACCFSSDTASASFNSWATTTGYKIINNRKLKDNITPWCTIISREVTVQLDSISKYTLDVKKQLNLKSGVWGGWQFKGGQ